MFRQLRLAMTGLFLAGCAALAQPQPAAAQGGPVPNVLVMGEDADQDTVPRNSRVFRQVLQEIQGEFNNGGYNYFDETAISGEYYAPDRTRRARGELCTIAKTVDTPIDVVILFSIYASTKKLDFMTQARMRVEGEMVDCQSGQGMGNFEVLSRDSFKLPVDCSRECLLEEMSKEARPLGRDLGNALVQLIDQRWTSTKRVAKSGGGETAVAATTQQDGDVGFVRFYDLCFDGFSQSDMLDVEEYLVVFKGYQSHRVARTQSTLTCYQYESASSQAMLSRNLVKMLDHAGYKGQVNGTGTSFTVVRIPERKRHPVDPSAFN